MVLFTARFVKVYSSIKLSCLDFLQQFWLVFFYFFFWQNVLFFPFVYIYFGTFRRECRLILALYGTNNYLSIYLVNWNLAAQMPTMHVIILFHNKRKSIFSHWTRLSWTSFAKGTFYLGSAHEFILQHFFHEYVRKVAIPWVYNLLLYRKSHDRILVVLS